MAYNRLDGYLIYQILLYLSTFLLIKTKEKTNALSQLMQSYNSRLQTPTAGPESYMNIKKSLSELDLQRAVDSNPFLKAQVEQRKLFPKGPFNFK